MHAGQLLQPVPGGIGRYEIALLRHLPAARRRPDRVRGRARPPERAPGVSRGSTSDRPTGALRYELWHRLRRPRVRIDADVVHAPSLAIPPVADRPLVVTVHDVAFLRVPETTTRRGVRFHSRGLDLARRHAHLVIAPSKFTGRELEARRLRPRPHRGRSLRRRSPRAARPRRDRRAVARAGVKAAVRARRSARSSRARTSAPIVHAVERLRAHASRPHAGRRRPARVGRGARARPAVRAGPRRATLDGARRARTAGPTRSASRRSTRASGSPPSRRWRAACRRSRRRARRSRKSCAAPVRCSPPAMSTPAPSSSRGSSTTRTCAVELRRAGVARAAELTWDRTRRGPRRAYARALERGVFVDSRRARPPRRLGGSRPPGRRGRLHDRARARNLGPRRRRPASAHPPRRHRPLARHRAGGRACTRSRRTADRRASSGSRPSARSVARRIRPDVWHGPTTRCRCARRSRPSSRCTTSRSSIIPNGTSDRRSSTSGA